MSATLFPNDILFSQRLLKAEGLYKGALDSIWGPRTEQAAMLFAQHSCKLAEEYGSFDPRTEKNIISPDPRKRPSPATTVLVICTILC